VYKQWTGLSSHYPKAVVDEFVVMPNHVHGVIHLKDVVTQPVGAGFQPAHAFRPTKPHHGLPEIIRGFKTYTTRIINNLDNTPGQPVWQQNYYEHVIWTEKELDSIRKYIVENPLKWAEDVETPEVVNGVSAKLGGLETRAYK